jgi:histone deacetylase complex regulatory component SIN3
MIHTDEDDEFDRILRENQMKGQPYHWESNAIKAAVLAEREACAKLCEELSQEMPPVGEFAAKACAKFIRGQA